MGNFNQFWLVKKANDFLDGFSNEQKGWSGKKMSACAVVITGISFPVIRWTNWAFQNDDWSLLIPILGILTGFVTALFAVNTYDKMKNPTPGKDSAEKA